MIGGRANIQSLKLVLFALLISLFSCSNILAKNRPLHDARQSFIYIQKSLVLHQCGKMMCLEENIRSMASGFIIKSTEDGSYGITAAHVCEQDIPKGDPPLQYETLYLTTTLNGEEYKAVVLATDSENDICMLFIKEMTDVPPLKITRKAPVPGDKVYSVGAPRGIFSPGMVPMFEGLYDGTVGIYAFYSIPAAPGSSGSMIINEKGELIGLLHSVYIKFPVIVLSVKHDDLLKFIRRNLKKFEAYRSVMDLLELEDIFSHKENKSFHEKKPDSTSSK